MTPSLETYITQKFGALEKLVTNFETQGEVAIEIEVVRGSEHHRNGEDMFDASAAITLPRQGVRGEATASDARMAIDRARDVLREEIEKYKEKHFDNYRNEKER